MTLTRAEKMDGATSESRNRVVDFLRSATITVVALREGTIIAVGADGGLLSHGVFDGAAWSHPHTLAFQVTPIPTWFLAAYLTVILVAPPCLVLWERFGWWPIIGGIVLAGTLDAPSLVTDHPLLGYPNYLLVRAVSHQFGYAWLDGRIAGSGRRLLLAAIGLVGLLSFVLVGP